jgi:hypothetical protein
MQSTITPDYLLDHTPFFGHEAIAVPDLPLARAAINLPLVPAPLEPTAELKALRIVRAKTGETEMRLFERKAEGHATSYVVRVSSINPSSHDDKVLKKGDKLMNEAQARATFERLVAGHYPAIVLRKDVHVPVHLDLL